MERIEILIGDKQIIIVIRKLTSYREREGV